MAGLLDAVAAGGLGFLAGSAAGGAFRDKNPKPHVATSETSTGAESGRDWAKNGVPSVPGGPSYAGPGQSKPAAPRARAAVKAVPVVDASLSVAPTAPQIQTSTRAEITGRDNRLAPYPATQTRGLERGLKTNPIGTMKEMKINRAVSNAPGQVESESEKARLFNRYGVGMADGGMVGRSFPKKGK